MEALTKFFITDSSFIFYPIVVTKRIVERVEVRNSALCHNFEKFNNFLLSQLGEPLLRWCPRTFPYRTWLLASRNRFYLFGKNNFPPETFFITRMSLAQLEFIDASLRDTSISIYNTYYQYVLCINIKKSILRNQLINLIVFFCLNWKL